MEHTSVLKLLIDLSNDDTEKKILEFISELEGSGNEQQFNRFIESFLEPEDI
jgi:hypothetical protein